MILSCNSPVKTSSLFINKYSADVITLCYLIHFSMRQKKKKMKKKVSLLNTGFVVVAVCKPHKSICFQIIMMLCNIAALLRESRDKELSTVRSVEAPRPTTTTTKNCLQILMINQMFWKSNPVSSKSKPLKLFIDRIFPYRSYDVISKVIF